MPARGTVMEADPRVGDAPDGAGTRTEDGAGFRGGNWNNTADNLRVSDRNNAANVNTERNRNNGWRAVRSAPSGLPAAP